jgi:hypothetical protein
VSRGIRKHKKETRESKRKKVEGYRKEIVSGFNLLMKWVPGTETLIRAEILMETVNYIKKLQNEIKEVKEESLKKSKELENKIKELEKELLKKKVNYIKELQKKIKELEKESPMECTPQSPKDMDSAPKITLHHYNSKSTEQHCTDSAPREPLMLEITSSPMETDISEPEMAHPTVKTFASTPTGASMRKTSSTMDAAVQTTSEAESVTPEEELLGSPEEELLVSPEEEMELLASGEELPEFNSMEDFRQWLEL